VASNVKNEQLAYSDDIWMTKFLQKFYFSESGPVNSVGGVGFRANLNLQKLTTEKMAAIPS